MNIFIDGVNTKNKGAELMLYAVLQELEKQHPDANVFLPLFGIPEGVSYLKTTMHCRQRKISSAARLFKKMKGDAFLRRLFHIPYSYTTDKYPLKGLDLLLDAGGFQFADQHYRSDIMITVWNNYYKALKKQGTKIFFLPQAFGPFETENGKKQARLLDYADCIFAREDVSYNHLVNAGIDKNKILLFPDFTALVDGMFSSKFEYLKNGIAIMPNLRMIDKNAIPRNEYIDTLITIINFCKTAKRTIFFLNNEAEGDFRLCEDANGKLDEKLPIVRDLTALEIKGLISQCYFVFSSRFHGIVSALSTGVPCLATSWSHKYDMLFRDYDMEGCAFDPGNNLFFHKLEQFLNLGYNSEMRNKLNINAKGIKEKNREMWQQVWMKYKQ